jgi:hypothetical protein
MLRSTSLRVESVLDIDDEMAAELRVARLPVVLKLSLGEIYEIELPALFDSADLPECNKLRVP